MDTPDVLRRAFPSLLLDEELGGDGETRLFRGRHGPDLQPVLAVITVSDRPALATIRRLEREFALSDDLPRPWCAVPIALLRNKGRAALILEDPGGAPLASLLNGLSIGTCLRIGTAFSAALKEVHTRGLIHKELKPEHVLVDLGRDTVSLIGFGLAASEPRRFVDAAPPEALDGTLAYMAPEQTGRMNRGVDTRSDLYAVGVILYQAVTGTLPFTASDPLELIHSHIARQPTAPAERDHNVPPVLSDVIMKLLAKMPEERYQTARGLEADLRHCLDAWNCGDGIDPFPLGLDDVPDRMLVPDKLYGREKEAGQLLGAWEGVTGGAGPTLVLICGSPGIGKSSLAHTLAGVVRASGGSFAAGKYDQHQRRIPYATLAEALRGLVRSLLARPEDEVARWRAEIEKAVYPNARVLNEIVPELQHLLGSQPDVPQVALRDAQDRFRSAFLHLMGALATEAHPLALFLDDLQWLEGETVELIGSLLAHPRLQHLLLVGAYRRDEVPDGHPVASTLAAIRAASGVAKVNDIVLSPLSESDTAALIASMLPHAKADVRNGGQDGMHEDIHALARLVHEKTGGNPFFAIHFVTNLHADGLLQFSAAKGGWSWNLEGVRSKGYTDNVLELMAHKLTRLSPGAQQALKSIALAGRRAEPDFVALDVGAPVAEVRTDLREAEQAGLLQRDGRAYAFAHDRIREAAYALVPEPERPAAHLRIGRLLLAQYPQAKAQADEDDHGDRDSDDDESLFELANHFRWAIALIEDPAERDHVRGLFTRAGKRAKAATAFEIARSYFTDAAALLPPDHWNTCNEEASALLLELAESEYVVGVRERGEALFREVAANARSVLDKALIYGTHLKVYSTPPGTLQDMVQIGLEGLRLFGLDCPDSDAAITEAIRVDEAEVATLLGQVDIVGLADAPEIADPLAAAALDLLADTLSPSSQSRGHMRWLTLQGLKICLRQGHNPSSAVIYAYYSVLLLSVPGRIQAALAFSDLAATLNTKYRDLRRRPTVLTFHAGLVHSWGRPFAAAKPLLDEAFAAARRVWDRRNGPAMGLAAVWISFEAGDPIDDIRASAGKYLDFAAQFSSLFSRLVRQYLQLAACLAGRTAGLLSFDDAAFNEEEAMDVYRRSGYLSGVWQLTALKLVAAAFLGQNEEALRCALALRELPLPFFSTLQAAAVFFHALAAAALHARAPAGRKAELAATVEEHLPRLKQWAEDCPENFLHRYQLILAEKARIEGRHLDAMSLYEQAIASARESGLIHMESLACERASRIHFELGLLRSAHSHLRDARAGYLRWGATAKVAELDREYPDIERSAASAPTATLGAPVVNLDLPHVIRASQALSGEIELDKLVATLVRLVLEHGGADRGLLLVPNDDGFRIEAEATVCPEGVRVELPRASVVPGHLCDAVVRYVVRTHERVLLDDAAVPGHLFSDDPYLAEHDVHALLSVPLLNQSRLVGVLYLENRLAAKAFTPSRLATLEVLASQAAIALENARLYADLGGERSRLQAVIEQVPLGLIIAEAPSGRLVVANATAHEVLRHAWHPAGAVSEYDRYHAFHPDGRRYQVSDWPLARALSAGDTIGGEEMEILWADGSRGWLSVSAAPIRDADGRTTSAVAVFDDITERHRREEALRASEERFAKAFHNNPTAMAVLRRKDWTFVDVNESFLSVLGCAREDVVGPSARELGTWFRELLERAGRRLGEAKPFRMEEHTAVDDANDPKTLLVSFDTIVLGQEACFLASFVDLTERKRVEEQLRQSQKMEAIGSLAGGVAHDFNNLLTAINGYSDLVIQRLPELDANRELVRSIRSAGERAAGLTRQLLAFSRKHRVDTRIETLDVIVSDMDSMLRRLVEEHIALATRLDASSGLVDVNRAQVEQILLNLVVNARDAMPSGGDLRIETQRVVMDTPPKGAVLTPQPGHYIRLSVHDTGAGIAPEIQRKIFEPFFTTKGVGKGSGLGLSVIYGIVKSLGGGIDVRSAPGHGTTFDVYLPEAEPKKSLGPELPAPAAGEVHGTETVLVVEDEPGVRTFIHHALTAQGYSVIAVGNGREALEVLNRGERVHVLVTDLIMPDLGGRELAQRVRKLAPTLPIVFTSGYSEDFAADEDIVAGGEHFLAKPFGPVDLARKLREVLDARH